MSILYTTAILLWPAAICRLAVNTEWFLLNWIESMLTISMSSSASYWFSLSSILFTSLAFLLLHTALKWPIFWHPTHVFPYAENCFWVPASTICTWLSYGYSCQHSFLGTIFMRPLWHLYFVKFFCFCNAAHDCSLCSLYLYSLCPHQYCFTINGVIHFHFCKFSNNFP